MKIFEFGSNENETNKYRFVETPKKNVRYLNMELKPSSLKMAFYKQTISALE